MKQKVLKVMLFLANASEGGTQNRVELNFESMECELSAVYKNIAHAPP